MKPNDIVGVWIAEQNTGQLNAMSGQNQAPQRGVVDLESSLEAVLMAGQFLPRKMFWTFGKCIEMVKRINKFRRFMG